VHWAGVVTDGEDNLTGKEEERKKTEDEVRHCLRSAARRGRLIGRVPRHN